MSEDVNNIYFKRIQPISWWTRLHQAWKIDYSLQDRRTRTSRCDDAPWWHTHSWKHARQVGLYYLKFSFEVIVNSTNKYYLTKTPPISSDDIPIGFRSFYKNQYTRVFNRTWVIGKVILDSMKYSNKKSLLAFSKISNVIKNHHLQARKRGNLQLHPELFTEQSQAPARLPRPGGCDTWNTSAVPCLKLILFHIQNSLLTAGLYFWVNGFK